MCVCAQRKILSQPKSGSSFSTQKFSACGRVILKARPQEFAAEIMLKTYAPTNPVPANAYRGINQDTALFFCLAGIENPGPVAERDIDSFLAQCRAKLDRKFVQHDLDFVIRQMA